MPNEKLKELPEVEQEEIKRILDLPNVNRFPSESDIVHLLKRADCLTLAEIKQFKLYQPIPTDTLGSEPVVPIAEKKPRKARKSPKIAKKIGKAKKVGKVIKKSKGKRK